MSIVLVGTIGVGVLLRVRADPTLGAASNPSTNLVEVAPPAGAGDAAPAPVSVAPAPTSAPPVTAGPTAASTQAAATATSEPAQPATPASNAVAQSEASTPATVEEPASETEAAPEPEPTPPAPAPRLPRPPTPAYRTYTVQPHDLLKQIAARYGVSMASIMAINTIPDPDSLRVGQVLRIPPPGS